MLAVILSYLMQHKCGLNHLVCNLMFDWRVAVVCSLYTKHSAYSLILKAERLTMSLGSKFPGMFLTLGLFHKQFMV